MAGRPPLDISQKRWLVSTGELAHCFGISQSGVRDMVMEGMPKEGRSTFHLPTCFQWRYDRRMEQAAELNIDLATRKAHLYDSQETKNRIEIAERLKQLMPATEVQAWFLTCAQAYVDSIESIPSRFNAAPADIARLEAEVRAARADLVDVLRDAAKYLRADISGIDPEP